MKTNQEMVRYIDSFSVVQRTSDGYFDGTELLRQWNNVEGNPRRQMSKFLESDNTSEFLKALAEDESHRAKMLIGENQLLIKVKGRNTKEGKTPDKVWMNPLLFIKFAMWINPAFEVKVLRFVYDEMIRYRNDAGDAYKELGSAVQKIVPKEFMPKAMQKVGEALSADMHIPISALIQVVKGGNSEQGTWLHEDVALEFARWLSPSFAIWCNKRIKELLQYGMTAMQPTLEQMINNPDLVISLATQLKNEREEKQRLEQQNALQEEQLLQAAPKVSYYDNHLQSVNTQTSTQVAKQIGMDAEKLHKKLKEIGVIYRQSGQWLLHTPYSTWGLHSTRTQTYTRSDGSIGTNVYTVWTTKGVRFIIALCESGWDVKKAIKLIKGELIPVA